MLKYVWEHKDDFEYIRITYFIDEVNGKLISHEKYYVRYWLTVMNYW